MSAAQLSPGRRGAAQDGPVHQTRGHGESARDSYQGIVHHWGLSDQNLGRRRIRY